MKTANNINTIFWDFDGVLMDSNEVRNRGFLEVLKDYPKNEVDDLMKYHQANGGLSRYVKFRYFFEEIRGEEITEVEIQKWANKFSVIMLKLLVNADLLIKETTDFVKAYYQDYNMHIVSGSDGKELNQICKTLEINQYFKSIHGSPTPKNQLVAELIESQGYNPKHCILVGDSVNDYDAAFNNNIKFFGFNNVGLKYKFENYIESFDRFLNS